ncbi:hypothetical protein B0H13DRAFT_1591663, partial [Mycena leptocephala]
RAEVFDDLDHPNIEATFEVPGVKSSDIYIFVQGSILSIQGHRVRQHRAGPHHSLPPSQKVERSHPMRSLSGSAVEEFHYGKFHRALRLPEGTKVSELSLAGLSDGLLTVSWPRRPNAAQTLIEGATKTI